MHRFGPVGGDAQILADLGVQRMQLMTNNPAKYGGLEGYGLQIESRIPLDTQPNEENLRYLETKRTRLGHFLTNGDDAGDKGEEH